MSAANLQSLSIPHPTPSDPLVGRLHSPHFSEGATMKKLSALCVLALSPTLGLAGFVSSSSAVADDSLYTWTYSLQLRPVLPVLPGPPRLSKSLPNAIDGRGHDRARSFTILDFEGYVAGSCAGPTGWVCRADVAGDMGAELLPDGDADIVNLTWAHLGGGPRTAGPFGARTPGGFSAQSIHGSFDTVSYMARNFNGWSMVTRPGGNNMGLTQGPTANAVLEPDSLALAGLGLVLAGLARRGRSHRPPA